MNLPIRTQAFYKFQGTETSVPSFAESIPLSPQAISGRPKKEKIIVKQF
jgi:hypothetical protein